MSRILVIDDDSGHRLILKSRLVENGHEAVLVDSGAKGLVEARAQSYDAFLVAARLGKGVDGYEVCKRLKGMPERAHVPVVLFNDGGTAHDDPARAFEAGCDAYVTKPDLPALDMVLRVHLRGKKRLEELSREVHSLHETVRKLHAEERPRSNGNDTGRDVGRENGRDATDHAAVLREIAAGRPDGVVVVDSEGTVRFADRGACELLGRRLEGMHLGDLAPSSGLEAFARDARIEQRLIAPSILPLEDLVRRGTFQSELYERLAAHGLRVPPLNERLDDIDALARHFVDRFGGMHGVRAIDDDVIELLRRHDWPGSVSELEDVIHTACELAHDGVLRQENMPRALRDAGDGSDEIIPTKRGHGRGVEGTHAIHDGHGIELRPRPFMPQPSGSRSSDGLEAEPLSLDNYEKRALLRAIEECSGDKIAAAKLLGVGKSTLYRKLKYHGIK